MKSFSQLFVWPPPPLPSPPFSVLIAFWCGQHLPFLAPFLAQLERPQPIIGGLLTLFVTLFFLRVISLSELLNAPFVTFFFPLRFRSDAFFCSWQAGALLFLLCQISSFYLSSGFESFRPALRKEDFFPPR